MKHVKSTDPRKPEFKKALMLAGGGTKVTNMSEDDIFVYGDVLVKVKSSGTGAWSKRGRFSVKK